MRRIRSYCVIGILLSLVLLLAVENSWSFPHYIPISNARLCCWWKPDALEWRQIKSREYKWYTTTKEVLQATPVKSSNTGFVAHPEDDTQESELRRAYESWRLEYGREFDPERYQNFRINYLKLMATNDAELKNARESGRPDPVPLSLNEYGDCSAEEYKTIEMGGNLSLSKHSFLLSTAFSAETPQEQQRIRQAYQEWCSTNEKQFDESRLNVFAFNLKVVENYYKKTGKKAELNRFADLSPEEYKAATASTEKTSTVLSSSSSTAGRSNPVTQLQGRDVKEQERIRNAYREWCRENGREYQESRLDIFATNLSAVESYRRETGKVVKLNQYADLSPEEYKVVVTRATSSDASATMTSYLDKSNATPGPPSPARAVNPMSSYLENLATPSPQVSLSVEDRIRKIYLDWCQYYGKAPNEDRLQVFAANLVVLEKHHRETGEELTLNEFADQTQGVESENERADMEMKRADEVRQEEQAEMARLEAERIRNEEQARFEDERKQTEKTARLESVKWQEKELARMEDEQIARLEAERIRNEEHARLENERRQAEESARLETLRRQEEERMEDRQRMAVTERIQQDQQVVLLSKQAKESTNEDVSSGSESNESSGSESNLPVENVMKTLGKQSEEEEEKTNSIALPRSSYMEAVARTWIDRSAYLESLQQGKTGVIPEPPPKKDAPWQEYPVQIESTRRSKSLIASIWDFVDDSRRSVSEQYANRLIADADEMIADASKSSDIDETDLRHLQEAVDALRRRKNDERGAERARTEAKEWAQIQRGLEKEARLAKERREYEERVAEEARQKARSMDASTGRVTNNEFPFLTTPFQGKKEGSPFDFPSISAVDSNIFSFLGGEGGSLEEQRSPTPKSLTQPVVVEKNESWLTFLFDFFGTNRQKEEPGQGTITLEPAKRTSVFDFFVSPDMFTPKQPGRGSIVIEEPNKPSIFSFFAKFGTRNRSPEVDPQRLKKLEEYQSRRRTRQEKLSWLEAGRSRILEETDKNLSRKEARRLQRELEALAAGNTTTMNADPNIPQLAKWTKTPDGRITGYVTETSRKFKIGTKITTSRIKGQVIKAGVTVTTTSGSQYRLGLPLSLAFEESRRSSGGQEAAAASGDRQSKSPLFGFSLGGIFGDDDMPSLVEWTQNEDGTITGFVNNKIGFEDGTQITTSPVDLGAKSGTIVQTRGGSKYKLLKERKGR